MKLKYKICVKDKIQNTWFMEKNHLWICYGTFLKKKYPSGFQNKLLCDRIKEDWRKVESLLWKIYKQNDRMTEYTQIRCSNVFSVLMVFII